MAHKRSILRAVGPRTATLLFIGFTLGGCNDYLERRQGISPVAGDAVRANIATHVIDPWPRSAKNRDLVFGAERLVEIIERSKAPPPAAAPPLAPTSTR